MSKLGIEIDKYQTRISVFSAETVENHLIIFSDLQDYRCKEQLESTITELRLRETSFDSYVLSWFGNKTTLLPENLFVEGDREHFFELCFGKPTPDQRIASDRIPAARIVNVYAIPEWIQYFFPQLFPRMTLRSEGSFIVEKLTASRTAELGIVLSLHSEHFLLAIAQSDALVYYATFDFQAPEDIVYHLMFTLQQKELLNRRGELSVFQGTSTKDDLSTELTTIFSKITELSALEIKIAEFTNIFELCE
jgi:hypothetical protein